MSNIDVACNRLELAVGNRRSVAYCLRLWSSFIRMRDGYRCIVCLGDGQLIAHHIVRKCIIPQARFHTGNGITLCQGCHRKPHAKFNRKADLQLPMDLEGGENLDLMTGLFGALCENALKRGMLSDRFYFLSDEVLEMFKRFQTIPSYVRFAGSRLQQAYTIWSQTPPVMVQALLLANGFHFQGGSRTKGC